MNTNLKLMCSIIINLGVITVALTTFSHAQSISKAESGNDLLAGGSWTGKVAPGSENVAIWISTSLGVGLTLDSATHWQGIAIQEVLTPVDVTGAGTLTLGSSGITVDSMGQNLTLGNPIAIGANQLWSIGLNRTLTVNGVVSGTGISLTKTGTGTLTLSGNNTYTGGTTLSAGTLGVTFGTLSSAGTSLITLCDSSTDTNNVQLNINALAVNNDITVANDGSGSATISYTQASGAGTLNLGNLTLNRAAVFTAPSLGSWMLFMNSGKAFSGSGALTIGASNGQRIILNTSNASAYTGDIAIQSMGIFEPRDRLSSTSGNNITVRTGGVLRIYGPSSLGALNGDGTVDSVHSAGTLQLGKGGASGCFAGTMKDNGSKLSLTKTGSGTQELFGAGITYTGNTSINQGMLKLQDATGFASTVSAASGTTLELNQASGTATFNFAFNGTSAMLIKSGGGTLTRNSALSVGVLTVSGGMLDLGATTYDLGFGVTGSPSSLADGAALRVRRMISANVDNPTFTQSGGTMTIGAIYIANGGRTGSYNLDAGTLHVLGYNSSVFLSNNGGSVNYYLNGGTIQVGASAANLIAGNAYVKEGGAYINDGGNSVTIQVPLRHGGIATTDGGLTKSGNGTLTLSATNTYTGATTNNAGTLLVNGTHTGGLDYSVLGGTLGGTGVVGSAVSVGASGTLTAGDASTSGTLTITGNVSFVSGGQLVVNILKGGYDQIDMNNTGAFDASNGKLTIIASPEPGGPVSGTRLVIVKNIKGPLANTFSNAANGATVYASDGFYYVICYDAAEHQIYLTVHRGTLIRFM